MNETLLTFSPIYKIDPTKKQLFCEIRDFYYGLIARDYNEEREYNKIFVMASRAAEIKIHNYPNICTTNSIERKTERILNNDNISFDEFKSILNDFTNNHIAIINIFSQRSSIREKNTDINTAIYTVNEHKLNESIAFISSIQKSIYDLYDELYNQYRGKGFDYFDCQKIKHCIKEICKKMLEEFLYLNYKNSKWRHLPKIIYLTYTYFKYSEEIKILVDDDYT